MKRFIYLVLVVAFIVALPVSHLVLAEGPPADRVCHRDSRVIPAPTEKVLLMHLSHGDCVTPVNVGVACICLLEDPPTK
jgi:hypothetical protein